MRGSREPGGGAGCQVRIAAATSTDPVDRHVAELAAVLRGPAAPRRSMLAETRDGLRDAAAAYADGGLSPERAAARAVAEFGAVPDIAPLYQDELTARQGRRTATLLAVAFPSVLLGWELLWSHGVVWSGPGSPALSGLSVVQDVISGVVALVALVLLVHTFRRSGSARRTAFAIGLTGAAGGMLCGGTAVVMNVGRGTNLAWLLATNPIILVAYVVSGVVLVTLVRSVGRTLRLSCPRGRRTEGRIQRSVTPA